MEKTLSRREFLNLAIKGGILLSSVQLFNSLNKAKNILDYSFGDIFADDALSKILLTAPKARFWERITQKTDCSLCHSAIKGQFSKSHSKNDVVCFLCAHNCFIKEGKRGKCKTRINIKGDLITLVYGRPMTSHTDPIEKKPFYHFLPGSLAFSFATSGCPFSCKFCQNWEISQASPEDYYTEFVSPSTISNRAKTQKVPIIAYTYNEPTVFSEYLLDVAREGKKAGLRSVLISCGFMGNEVLKEMIETLDAIKIDLKGFSEDFYKNVSAGSLKPVLRNIKTVAKSNVHLEIVNLVVPTLNDKDEDLKNLAKFVRDEAGYDTPLHFTRFHPDYQLLNLPPTPIETLEKAREIAMGLGLKYVYVGNVPGHPGNNTYCPKCKKVVIDRKGFFVSTINLKGNRCSFCGETIKGVFE
jgi:pyruvate formate lyase activating enzyme